MNGKLKISCRQGKRNEEIEDKEEMDDNAKTIYTCFMLTNDSLKNISGR